MDKGYFSRIAKCERKNFAPCSENREALLEFLQDKAEEVLEAIKSEKYGENAAIIGEVVEGDYVIVNTPIGGERILEAPIADPVPRVC